MMLLTKAARMAWEIGAAEAARLRHPFIEREHLLIGLCSLRKILQYLDYTHIESLPVDVLREEADGIERVLAPLGITDASIRRGVRSRLRPGNAVHVERMVHRSLECKRHFYRASEIVKDGGGSPYAIFSPPFSRTRVRSSPRCSRERGYPRASSARSCSRKGSWSRSRSPSGRRPGIFPSHRNLFPPRRLSWTGTVATLPAPRARGVSCRSSIPTGPETPFGSSSRSS